jgi:hypothetical protein
MQNLHDSSGSVLYQSNLGAGGDGFPAVVPPFGELSLPAFRVALQMQQNVT